MKRLEDDHWALIINKNAGEYKSYFAACLQPAARGPARGITLEATEALRLHCNTGDP